MPVLINILDPFDLTVTGTIAYPVNVQHAQMTLLGSHDSSKLYFIEDKSR